MTYFDRVGSGTHRHPIAIEPCFQHYAWGDLAFIPTLYGLNRPDRPYAEAWLGAHNVSPSPARIDGEKVPLNQLIASDPEAYLGRQCHSEFGELPFLAKVLSAARPLSIQVHPSKAQAAAGYRRETAAAIPLDSPLRNYRDRNSKPEVLIALTSFWALVGFRPAAEIGAAISRTGKLARLLPSFDDKPDWLERLVAAYFSIPDSHLLPALTEWIEDLSKSAGAFGGDTPEYWAVRCHRLLSPDHHPDRGLLFAFLLNLIELEPWQALFIDAGTPHAYLSGSGIEVMANSDNVLRGGLTPKHIDVDEFLKILRYETANPFTIRSPQKHSEGIFVYKTPAEEFEVERLVLDRSIQFLHTADGPVLLMFLGKDSSSRLTVNSGSHKLELSSPASCFLAHGAKYQVSASGTGDLIRVLLPAREIPAFRGSIPTRLNFGTSGLRGLVTDITDLEAYVNVRGYLDYLVETGDAEPRGQIVIAGDLRPSTDSPGRSIMAAVASACCDAGFGVLNQGKIPTPALSYYAFQKQLPSIMVTGSHIPFDRNGIKFNKPGGELLKSDEAPVLRAVERARRTEYVKPRESSRFDDRGMFRSRSPEALPPAEHAASRAYLDRYTDFFPENALNGVRIVVYQHSAVGRDLIVEILRALGAEVHAMGRTETFVPIDTEAISEADLSKLTSFAKTATQQFGKIDAIVSTDGDSDRPLIVAVDSSGEIQFVPGDLIGILVAEYLNADLIAVPVSATDAIELRFRDTGVRIVRTRIGSPFVIAAMNEVSGKRKVGFEANGGFLVGSVIERGGRTLQPLPTRDSTLPILALLHAAKEKSVTLWNLVKSLPKRYGKSGLIDAVPREALDSLTKRFSPGEPNIVGISFEDRRVEVTRTDGRLDEPMGAAVTHVVDLRRDLEGYFSRNAGFGDVLNIDFRDGLRIRFDSGDIAHIRASGNAPQLRIYAFADTEERAAQIVAMCVKEPDGILRSLLTSGR